MHDKKVLQSAEEFIKQTHIKRTHSLGAEIEDLPIWILPPKEKNEYKKLYWQAREETPEIWESCAYTFKSEMFYKNKEFFEWVFELSQVDFLLKCYPAEKERIADIYNNSKWRYFSEIEAMYDYLRNYLRNNDECLNFSELCEIVNYQHQKTENNIKPLKSQFINRRKK